VAPGHARQLARGIEAWERFPLTVQNPALQVGLDPSEAFSGKGEELDGEEGRFLSLRFTRR
jgi:hypothetical protein